MKSNLAPILLFLLAALALSPLATAQGPDPDLAKMLKEAEEQSKKMNLKAPDMKEQLAEMEKEEAKEKAALQKQFNGPGPIALPAWAPQGKDHACHHHISPPQARRRLTTSALRLHERQHRA